MRIRSLDICALPRRKPSDRYCRAGIGHRQNLGNRGRLADRRLLPANDGLRFGCGDGIKIGVNISNPMADAVSSRAATTLAQEQTWRLLAIGARKSEDLR
jgi:hypothetical protein